MADKDFRIDLILGAKFAEGFRALDEAKRKIDGAERSVDKFGKTGINAAAALRTTFYAATAAAGAAVAVMGLYIQKTIEAEKVQAQLQARIRDTGGAAGKTLEQLNQRATDLSRVTVFDDEAIGGVQAMLLTFRQIQGLNFDRATEAVLNVSTAMGTDLNSAALQVGKALNDPVGQMTALSRAGIQFSDDQKKVIKSLVETGQTAKAQTLILDELDAQMGTAARSARNTLGGALQTLKNDLDNVIEGDSGDAGVVGMRKAVEGLIDTLEDPSTRAGFQAFIGDLVQLTGFAVKAISAVGGLANAIRENFKDIKDKSYNGLLAARASAEDELARSGGRGIADANDPIGKLLGLRTGGSADELRARIKQIDAQLAALRKADQDAAFEAAHPIIDHGGEGQFANVNGINTPVDTGGAAASGNTKPPKSSGGAKTDPDAAAKDYLADLQRQVDMLGLVKDGEDSASEAAKAHYEVTEGKYKNASQALKDQIEAAAQSLDAQTKEREETEKAKDAYDDLLKSLRTPAEVAVDDAIEKLDTLTEAMRRGIGTKEEFDKAQQDIVKGLVGDQPDFQGLAPEVGGAFGELLKLDQATEDEQKWYDDSLARLAAYRTQKNADLTAAAAEQEAIEQQHQQRMAQIEGAKQQASLQLVSGFLGQIAELQHSQNARAARIGKAAAIAQAIINTYQAATEAYKAMAGIPYVGPALGVAAAAAAIAAGLANVAAIRSQPTGYAEGGYTGSGGKFEPAGIVHRGEGVLTQEEIAQLGGPAGFERLRAIIADREALTTMIRGYAEGGFVEGPSLPSVDLGRLEKARAESVHNNSLSLYNLFDLDDLAQKINNHPSNEKAVVVYAGDNGTAIRSKW